MVKGIIYALAACLIWGLIFVVPQFMEEFSPLEVALGRYFFYGLISVTILLKSKLQGTCRYPLSIWIRALCFSFSCTLGYYTFVVLALRYATPAICTLILGLCPIAIAFYGNWKKKECSYRSLILPTVLICLGLAVINVPHLTTNESYGTYLLGLLCCFWALIAWTWYMVSNSQFLKSHPEVITSDWSTLIGVAALFWAGILVGGILLFWGDELVLEKYSTSNPALTSFIIGSAILGFLCSWLGSFLWNRASLYLSIPFAGQLTIFETIFGLCFVYGVEQRFPPLLEAVGIALLLSASFYSIRASSKSYPQEALV